MSCPSCADLCVRVPIRSPDDLERRIAFARDKVAAGMLREPPATPYATPLADVARRSAWPDIVYLPLACSACGQAFTLHCETYHGAGGAWTWPGDPEEPQDEDGEEEDG